MFKKILVMVSILVFISTTSVFAEVIDFEDVVSEPGGKIVDPYKGFNWNNDRDFSVVNASNYGFIGSGYHTLDPDGVVGYNAYGYDPIIINRDDGSLFDFIGADFAGAWNSADIHVEGWIGSTMIDSVVMGIDTNFVTNLVANFSNIEFLKIYSVGSDDQWCMDNFEYEVGNTAPVPEPATMILFGIGLTGLISIHYKRKKS